MLRRTPSLAMRAGLIFISIYTVILAAVLTVAVISNATEPVADSQEGARMALRFARRELTPVNGSFEFPGNGNFARLAAKNPSMWLVGRSGDRFFSVGPVPKTALELFSQYQAVLDSADFSVQGTEPLLSGAEMQRFGVDGEPLVLAAGGVDPATLPSRGSWHQLGPPVLLALIAIAVLGFVAMLIALPFFSRAIRPITAEAEAVSPQESDRRLDERTAPRELLPLVQAFNATLDRLGAELARRKRFIADAAHELRTPLAVVALRVEALKDETAKEELRRGIERLVHVVSQMLDLERLSLLSRERSTVDLSALARDVVAELAPMAMKAGYEVSLDAPDSPVTVTGDAHAITRAVTNLFGNAIVHGGGSGQIRVVVGAEGVIDVIDEGPGIPPNLLPELFEPFSRGSQDAEGCGLGLHLTREIMRAHGGDVRLVPSERGATFRLSFAS